MPWGAFSILFFIAAQATAILLSAPDRDMGNLQKIMYVHVPAAWWSMFAYAFMAGASFVSLVWRHALADVAARAAAPVGAVFAAVCLVTGSLWGAPTWGTWWEWDGRMTSMLVLFVTFLGYIALWASIEEEERAARLAAILCLVGAINLPIVKFSVDWWSTLHQPASIMRSGGSAIDESMIGPLLTMAAAYLLLFGALTMMNMRTAIFRRRVESAALRKAQV
jgi:heme exporter protein C